MQIYIPLIWKAIRMFLEFYENSYHTTQNIFLLLIHKYNFICNSWSRNVLGYFQYGVFMSVFNVSIIFSFVWCCVCEYVNEMYMAETQLTLEFLILWTRVLQYKKCLYLELFTGERGSKQELSIKGVKIQCLISGIFEHLLLKKYKNDTFAYVANTSKFVILTSILYLCECSSGCLLGFCTHHHDDGGSKVLWNVGEFLPDYTALRPRRQPSSYQPPW
jgi:hypothetical protein